VQRAFLSRAPKSSREALQANLPRSPRSIDSKTGSRAVWRKSSIFLDPDVIVMGGGARKFRGSTKMCRPV